MDIGRMDVNRTTRAAARCASLLCALIVAGCAQPEIDITETPVKVVSESIGAGRKAQAGDTVTISYRVSLPTGKEIMHDDEFAFIVGGDRGQLAVITAVDQAVRGMQPGGTRLIDCPPQHHWGREGYADRIPPNTNLLINIRMRSVQ